jgi:energy-coupling factor transporter ATP-binding protein EcfA2
MSVWDFYPPNYRQKEVKTILSSIRAGESVSLLGLSGAGKSNLLGFLANRVAWEGRFVLVDGNRLAEPIPTALYHLIYWALTGSPPDGEPYPALTEAIDHDLRESSSGVCLLLDRFDALEEEHAQTAASNLRALRDTHKYSLTFVFATRRPLDPLTELAELVFANTLWLGPLSNEDIAWNIERYAARKDIHWGTDVTTAIRKLSGGYPSLLRAVCEAHAMGCPLELDALSKHPAVSRRIAEFWVDEPTPEMIALSGLHDHPLLGAAPPPIREDSSTHEKPTWEFDPLQFSAKEQLLLEYLHANPNQVCEKDAVIHAVWPEDKIYETGVRDDSLAQLVRRVRLKIEPDPSNPRHLHTVPGRGYLFKP